jgi:hypothetical protein
VTGLAPVSVVGLGPVGSTAALLLAAQGVPTLTLERDLEVSRLPRAVSLHDEALRVLQAAGLDTHPRPALLTSPTVRFRSRRAPPLLELAPHPSPYGHPSLAFFRQPDLNAALRGHMHEQDGIEVRLGQEVQGLRQDAEGVVLAVPDVRSGGARAARGGAAPARGVQRGRAARGAAGQRLRLPRPPRRAGGQAASSCSGMRRTWRRRSPGRVSARGSATPPTSRGSWKCRSPRSPPPQRRGCHSIRHWAPGSRSSKLASTRQSGSTQRPSVCSSGLPPAPSR